MSKKKILVVDDNRDFRSSLRELIETGGYSVTEAKDGNEATRHLDSTDFDLIITDILMPEKDGFELLKEIMTRRLPTKTIVVTGGGKVEAERYLRYAKSYPVVNAQLKKPFGLKDLFYTIKRLIG